MILIALRFRISSHHFAVYEYNSDEHNDKGDVASGFSGSVEQQDD